MLQNSCKLDSMLQRKSGFCDIVLSDLFKKLPVELFPKGMTKRIDFFLVISLGKSPYRLNCVYLRTKNPKFKKDLQKQDGFPNQSFTQHSSPECVNRPAFVT